MMRLEAGKNLYHSRSSSLCSSSSRQSCDSTTEIPQKVVSKRNDNETLLVVNQSKEHFELQSESTTTCLWDSSSSTLSFSRKIEESGYCKIRVPLNYQLQEEQQSLVMKLNKLFLPRENDSSTHLTQYHHSVRKLLDTHFYNVLKLERESTQTRTRLHETHSSNYIDQIDHWKKHAEQTLEDLVAVENIHQNLDALSTSPTKSSENQWRISSLQILKKVWNSFPESLDEADLIEAEPNANTHSYFTEEFCYFNARIEEFKQKYEELREDLTQHYLAEGVPVNALPIVPPAENGEGSSQNQQLDLSQQSNPAITSYNPINSAKRCLKNNPALLSDKQSLLRDTPQRNCCAQQQSNRKDSIPIRPNSTPSASITKRVNTQKCTQTTQKESRYQSLTKTFKAKEKVKLQPKRKLLRPWL